MSLKRNRDNSDYIKNKHPADVGNYDMLKEGLRRFYTASLIILDFDWRTLKEHSSASDELLEEFRRFLVIKAICRDTEDIYVAASKAVDGIWVMMVNFSEGTFCPFLKL